MCELGSVSLVADASPASFLSRLILFTPLLLLPSPTLSISTLPFLLSQQSSNQERSKLNSPINPLAHDLIERHLPQAESRLVEHLRRAAGSLDDFDQRAEDRSGRVFEGPDELTDGSGGEEEGESLEGDVFGVEGGAWERGERTRWRERVSRGLGVGRLGQKLSLPDRREEMRLRRGLRVVAGVGVLLAL